MGKLKFHDFCWPFYNFFIEQNSHVGRLCDSANIILFDDLEYFESNKCQKVRNKILNIKR